MDKIFTTIRSWIARLVETEGVADPIDRLGLRDYADLPTAHPGAIDD